MPDFPSDFIFGVSTSAYQIEGAVREGGRGETVWDRFCHLPGNIANDDHADVACDHYHRYGEDIDLMAELGLDAYRFSLSWARIFPEGSGAISREGLDFYDRLIDTLLERGIEPWVCYHHFDLPQKLHVKGGWAARDVAYWYADYVGETGAQLADRVERHLLMNEPSTSAALTGLHGTRYRDHSSSDIYHAALHHLNLATGLGAAALRSVNPGLTVGTALEAPWIEPARDEEEDFHAAGKARDWLVRAFLDPLLDGLYPEAVYERLLPFIRDGDLAKTVCDLDFLGLNYQTHKRIVAADTRRGYREVEPPEGARLSDTGLEVRPGGIGRMVMDLGTAWPDLDLYITDAGSGSTDGLTAHDQTQDRDRIAYLAESLQACLEAIDKGARLKGYLPWTLMDCFEWTQGYTSRRGLVRVDRGTQTRTPRASYNWYRDVVQSRRLK